MNTPEPAPVSTADARKHAALLVEISPNGYVREGAYMLRSLADQLDAQAARIKELEEYEWMYKELTK